MAKKLRLAIETELTPRQRELVIMYYLRQMPMPEIAAALGISVPAVSRTIARARTKLERCLRYCGTNFLRSIDDD